MQGTEKCLIERTWHYEQQRAGSGNVTSKGSYKSGKENSGCIHSGEFLD
jgi:hypothetical protein